MAGVTFRGLSEIYWTVKFYDYFLLMETLRLNFERAWRGVIAPAQYSYNINTICPREELIHGRIIERIDFIVCND